MNDKKVISGLKAILSRLNFCALTMGLAALIDWMCLDGKAVKLFLVILLISIFIGGLISSFIEAYEE
jgi:uncharacterized membrane protein YwzB